jgi:hypothetical protein
MAKRIMATATLAYIIAFSFVCPNMTATPTAAHIIVMQLDRTEKTTVLNFRRGGIFARLG